DDKFLFYRMQFWDSLKDGDVAITGATLNKDKLSNILCYYPESIEEQKKIAEILSKVDEYTQSLEEYINKLEQLLLGVSGRAIEGKKYKIRDIILNESKGINSVDKLTYLIDLE